MFEKISRAAERAASGVGTSRRGFLGQLGRGALFAAGAVGGLLLLPGGARAGGHSDCFARCCQKLCGKGDKTCSCSLDAYATCSGCGI
jgi:hypothetical protein